MIVGLTGAYCAGKNHVGRLLEARGFQVLDVDKLGHRAIELEKEAIVTAFGASILRSDGAIDRKILGQMAFTDPKRLADLEEIIHPAANRLTDEWISEREGLDIVINAALLHRSSAFDRCDIVILVRASYLTRLFRAKSRDKLPLGVLIERFRSQNDFESQYFRKRADIQIVKNRGFFGPCSALHASALARRLDSILARKGTDR